MSRPRISAAKRHYWKEHPIMRPGITFTPDELRTLQALQQKSEIAQMQRLILATLQRAIDGPRTRAMMRNGRKVLRAVK